MMAFGATRAEAEAKVRSKRKALVLPATMKPLIDLVQATTGQWRMASGLSGLHPVALDNNAVQATAEWLGIKINRDLAIDLRIVEDEALKAMAAS